MGSILIPEGGGIEVDICIIVLDVVFMIYLGCESYREAY